MAFEFLRDRFGRRREDLASYDPVQARVDFAATIERRKQDLSAHTQGLLARRQGSADPMLEVYLEAIERGAHRKLDQIPAAGRP